MFTILWYIIVGLIVGALARLILPGRDPMGWLATILLGIAGAVVGGYVGRLIIDRPAGSSIFDTSFIFSLLGAILLLWLWRMIQSKRT